ncbi:MAG: ATP-binding cassette domain-containing protein [Promethearchaeota archaeon]
MSVEAIQLEKVYKRLSAEQTSFTSRLRAFIKRDYQKVKALDDVSFRVEPGEKVTILGPNGAGKSTIIKILTGIIQSDKGKATINGFNPQKERYDAAYQFGVVFGHRSLLWRHIPVLESLRLYRDVYDLNKEIFEKRLTEFISVLEIKPFLHRQPRRLSLGERMRCELAASLIHNPSIVFLDEPTIGLDIVAARRIREFINERNELDGTTVILCSHNVKDIEQICTRAILLLKGKIYFDGPTKELATVLRKEKQLVFTFRTHEKPVSTLVHFLQKLSTKDNIKITNQDGGSIDILNGDDNSIRIEYNTDAIDLDFLIQNLLQLVDRVLDIQISDADLEDVIEELYTNGAKGGELPS